MPRSKQSNQIIRQETEKKILDSARIVFGRKGSSATMADVAEEARVSQGLAYRYFASKEEILTKLVKIAAQSGGGAATRIKEIQGTPGERLALLVTYILNDRRERPEFYQFLYQVLADEMMPDELRRLVRKNGRIILDAMRQLIIEGQTTGEVTKDDPDQMLTALIACIDGLVKRIDLGDPKTSNRRFPDARIILRMLKPESS
jgi:AcrR family transcriptional regulator